MSQDLKVGIIGFDTSHVPAFTKLLNDPSDPFHVAGAKVVVGYPTFSADLESSASRVEGYTKQMKEEFGIQIVDSVEAVLEQVDAVLLESVDGRRHLEEAKPVLVSGKPLFIDKPLAANYREAAEIIRLAQEHNSPVFSSSSLRFDANIAAIRQDETVGDFISCDAFSPGSLDPSNPGLFWYGVHGVEILYTFMGRGCQRLRCYASDDYHVTVGFWPDGRTATVRSTRCGAHDYGVTVFGSKRVAQTLFSREVPLYSRLLNQIIPFFQGGPAPVEAEETLEMMAFMQAAFISENEDREVSLQEVTE